MKNGFSEWLRDNVSDNQKAPIIDDAETKNGVLYVLPQNEISKLFNVLKFNTYEDAAMYIGYLNKYCEWYEENVIHIAIHKRFSFSKKEINSWIINRVDTIGMLSMSEIKLFLENTINYNEKWIILAPYEGIGCYDAYAEDLTLTNRTGINKENCEIEVYSGRIYKVSPMLLDIALKAANEDEQADVIGKIYKTTNFGKIFRYKYSNRSSLKPDVLHHRVLMQLYYYRKRTGFIKCKFNMLTRSGMVNQIRERVGSDILRTADQNRIQDILERYNATDTLYSSVQNLVRRTRPI